MQLETLIRNFRVRHGMRADSEPIAFLGSEISIRSLGGDIFINSELKAEIGEPEGWGRLLELNLANQKRFRHSMGFSEENAAIVLWRKIPNPSNQATFDEEVEHFATAIKYWRRLLRAL